MTSTDNPDLIRSEIEVTRSRISSDVNALADEANPKNIARRQVDKVKEGAQSLKEKVFGSDDDDTYGYGHDDRASRLEDAKQAARDVGTTARRKAQGNPLAAGLIAFGAGALIGSLVPASEQEKKMAVELKDRAQPLVDEVSAAAKDAIENVRPAAQEAAESVKQQAAVAAENVKSEGQLAAADVKGTAQDSAASVRDTRP